MNILITVSTYYPEKDGVAVVTKYLAEGLAAKGNNVTVVTSLVDNNSEEKYNDVTIKRVNLYTKAGFYYGEKKEYLSLIEKELTNTDVMINVCTQNAFTDLLLKNIKKYKCKKILYMHGMYNFRYTKLDFSSVKSILNKLWKEIRWLYYYFINANNFKCYDKVIQLHEKDDGYKFFKKFYNIDSKVIENATDDMFFETISNEKNLKNKEKYIIYVANYSDGKNQKLAIKQYLKANIDKKISLICIGSKKNNYYYELEKLSHELKKKYGYSENEKKIILLTEIERKSIPEYVKNAEFFLMTSKGEKYPLSLIEAMACGTPFITTKVGIAESLPGGIISKPKEISKNIEKLITDENLSTKLGKEGYEYARKYAMKKDKIEMLNQCIKDITK